VNLLKNADSESAPCHTCSVTFKFIGDRILLSIPRGKSGEHGMEKLMREWASFLEAIPCAGLMP